MTERVELMRGFAVSVAEGEPGTAADRDNVQWLWDKMSAEQKAHNVAVGNVKLIELTPEGEAIEKEAARDKSLDGINPPPKRSRRQGADA